jgi:hypothetical protein
MQPLRLRVSTKLIVPALMGAAAISWAGLALAGFNNPFVPGYRGQPNTEYGSWESFNDPFGAINLPDDPNSNTVDAGIEQLDQSAFLIGGNIYSFSAPLDCVLTDTTPGDLQELDLQISTKGEELHYAGVVLEYVDDLGQTHALPWTTYTELFKTTGMGVNVESQFHWDLSGVVQVIDTYQVTFKAAAPSMSLDAVVLDTRFSGPVATYCTAKQNSQGCITSIGHLGTASASLPEPFLITGSKIIPNTVGLLIYGTDGPGALPFQGGILCINPPVIRTPGQTSGGQGACTGSFNYDFNVLIQSGANPVLVPGRQVQAQYWSRDLGFAPPNSANLTDALQFVIQL